MASFIQINPCLSLVFVCGTWMSFYLLKLLFSLIFNSNIEYTVFLMKCHSGQILNIKEVSKLQYRQFNCVPSLFFPEMQVPFLSPLEGHIYLQLDSHGHSDLQHQGFLVSNETFPILQKCLSSLINTENENEILCLFLLLF